MLFGFAVLFLEIYVVDDDWFYWFGVRCWLSCLRLVVLFDFGFDFVAFWWFKVVAFGSVVCLFFVGLNTGILLAYCVCL